MDNYYSAVTNWAIFGTVAAAGLYYYWPKDQHRGDRFRQDAHHAERRRRQDKETRGRQARRPSPEGDVDSITAERTAQTGNENVRKRKVQTKEPAQSAPAVVVQASEPEKTDMSDIQWAQQMQKARVGADLTTTKNKEQRVKTVKQSSAVNTPNLSSSSSQADDEAPPVQSPELKAGDVSDMLEPVAAGPSSLRITPSSKPQKEKLTKQPKEEIVETKKQRQNRQKAEERRHQQQADEQARKALEEKQRRAAREARGEPAKNGMQSTKAPANSAWTAKPVNGIPTPPAANVSTTAPLLDTFEVESNSSSNGGQVSTAATSTSGGRRSYDLDLPSEEDQLAQAMRQSEDESGWTTVAQPKKSKKKPAPVEAEPVLTNKTNIPAAKPVTNGKPKGFQALDVQYEQRTDADPSDASNWDA